MIPEDNISIISTSSGLRAVCQRKPGVAEFFGVATMVGSRDETPDLYGMAHFVEHTIFKGTSHRRAGHIINRMEAVGGELNAYTTKEKTVVYSAFPAGNLRRAAELTGDLLCHSEFPDRELDREREVVADEIASYLDTPSEAVFDDFEDLAFAGTGLGHNILGLENTLRTFDSHRCREFLHRFYTAPNMVAFYSGPESPYTIGNLLERHFSDLPTHSVTRDKADFSAISPFHVTREAGLHQSHTVMGKRVEGVGGRDTYAMALLTNILGGPGMNSLLNVALREKRGLVYTVEAGTTLYSDTGLFTVYFGCDSKDTDRCRRMVETRIKALAENPIPERKLAAYIRQYTGQMMLARDNREQSALAMARSMLYHGRVLSLKETIERISGVTPQRIMAAAEKIASPDFLTFH